MAWKLGRHHSPFKTHTTSPPFDCVKNLGRPLTTFIIQFGKLQAPPHLSIKKTTTWNTLNQKRIWNQYLASQYVQRIWLQLVDYFDYLSSLFWTIPTWARFVAFSGDTSVKNTGWRLHVNPRSAQRINGSLLCIFLTWNLKQNFRGGGGQQNFVLSV